MSALTFDPLKTDVNPSEHQPCLRSGTERSPSLQTLAIALALLLASTQVSFAGVSATATNDDGVTTATKKYPGDNVTYTIQINSRTDRDSMKGKINGGGKSRAGSISIKPASSEVAVPANGAQAPLGTFPFKRDGQLMMVEVSIDKSRPVWFVVDSASSHTVFDPKFAKELGLKTESASPTNDTGAGEVAQSHTRPVVMTLNGVKVDVPQPWVIDLSKAPLHSSVRGLVGAELFKAYVLKMDPQKSTFSVYDSASYRHEEGGALIPFFVEGDKLFLEAALEVPAGRTVTHKLRIATGSESSVNDEIVKQSAEVRTRPQDGGLEYSGVFTSVKIGPYVVNHVWGPGEPRPAIGMEMLRRFIVTFDAPRGRIHLEPTPALNDPVPTPPPN